ncbi:MAG: alpha/beta hydrolase [Sphingomonas sp.]
MKKSCFIAASALLAIAAACDATPATPVPNPQQKQWQTGGEEVPLWPAGLAIARPDMEKAGAPETSGDGSKQVAGRPWTWVGNVQHPTMTIYRPKGTNSHAALMVFPGGGYEVLAIDLEGSEVCEWATRIGMTCVVLKYRVPQDWHPMTCRPCDNQPTPFLPLQDAERAMGLLRQRAAILGIDPHKIGVVGFSAGGHLVTAISNATGRSYTPVDAADQLSARPDFAMPIYPGHLWSGQGIALHDYDPVRADGPPNFIVQAEDDPVDDVRNSISYFLALKAAKVPAEMHIYAHGGHAFGLRPTNQPITRWPVLAEAWLRNIGMLPKAG